MVPDLAMQLQWLAGVLTRPSKAKYVPICPQNTNDQLAELWRLGNHTRPVSGVLTRVVRWVGLFQGNARAPGGSRRLHYYSGV